MQPKSATAAAAIAALCLAGCRVDPRPDPPSTSSPRQVTQAEAMSLARRAVAASALVGGYATIEVDAGRLILRSRPSLRELWDWLGCDVRERVLEGLFEQWTARHPAATGVELLSDAGKELGRFPPAPDHACE